MALIQLIRFGTVYLLSLLGFTLGGGLPLVAHMVRDTPVMQETRDWFLGWEDPWERKTSPLQCSSPENPRETESLAGTVHGGATNRMWLSSCPFTSVSPWILSKQAASEHSDIQRLALFSGADAAIDLCYNSSSASQTGSLVFWDSTPK